MSVVLTPKVPTGIPGFDHITHGGLSTGRTTLVSGTAGSGKTVFAAQFLWEGVKRAQPGVFVTFEEPAADLRHNLASLGWDIESAEADDMWRFVDASPVLSTTGAGAASIDFGTLLAQVGAAVDRTAAQRIAFDSMNVAFADREPAAARLELRRLSVEMRRLRLTAVMTNEIGPEQSEDLFPHGYEQFVADNVVILRNGLEDEKRRRTIEVLKMRGAMHRKGEYPFTVLPDQGIVVIPLSMLELPQPSSTVRVTSGNAGVDALCSGGFFRDSVVLTSGPTGTGKTLMATEFVAGGAERGERAMLLAFEESREQIFRNAEGWGRDFVDLRRRGLLRVVASYPEVASLEDHLVEITREIERFRPTRVAIDSLTALERSGTEKGFREFLLVLTSYVKSHQLSALFTAATPALLGAPSATDAHISTLTDGIVLLRYVELDGTVKRGITVLKMRGSAHDTRVHEFTIDGTGMRLGEPFRGVSGILAGHVVALPGNGREPG